MPITDTNTVFGKIQQAFMEVQHHFESIMGWIGPTRERWDLKNINGLLEGAAAAKRGLAAQEALKEGAAVDESYTGEDAIVTQLNMTVADAKARIEFLEAFEVFLDTPLAISGELPRRLILDDIFTYPEDFVV